MNTTAEKFDITKKRTRKSHICPDGVGIDSQALLRALVQNPGQGSRAEQEEKIIRTEQREWLFQMIKEAWNERGAGKKVPVEIKHNTRQIEMKVPEYVRLFLPTWKGRDDVYWRALCDRVKLAIGTVVDADAKPIVGTLSVKYYNHVPGRSFKDAESVGKIVQSIAFLIEEGDLTVDFRRYRQITEEEHDRALDRAKVWALLIAAFEMVFKRK